MSTVFASYFKYATQGPTFALGSKAYDHAGAIKQSQSAKRCDKHPAQKPGPRIWGACQLLGSEAIPLLQVAYGAAPDDMALRRLHREESAYYKPWGLASL